MFFLLYKVFEIQYIFYPYSITSVHMENIEQISICSSHHASMMFAVGFRRVFMTLWNSILFLEDLFCFGKITPFMRITETKIA